MIPRRFAAAVAPVVLLSAGAVGAEVPVLGRWQEFAYPAQAVEKGAGAAYQRHILELSRQGKLDDDRVLLARARRIADTLVREAVRLKPAAGAWAWEIHTTSVAAELPSSAAGGKLLLGSAYIHNLDLTDGELATLIAHEVAHGIAEHQRETLSQVFYLNEALLPISVDTAMEQYDTSWALQIRLAKLSRIQESEADQLGMTIAHMAGWPSESMVTFFRKLAATQGMSVLNWNYPLPSSRVAMASTFARWFPRPAETSQQQRLDVRH